MRQIVWKVARVANGPRILCQWALGVEHSLGHRMVAGAGFMVCGVLMAKTHWAVEWAQYVVDGVGYALHGLGTAPFVEWLTEGGEKVAIEVAEEFPRIEI